MSHSRVTPESPFSTIRAIVEHAYERLVAPPRNFDTAVDASRDRRHRTRSHDQFVAAEAADSPYLATKDCPGVNPWAWKRLPDDLRSAVNLAPALGTAVRGGMDVVAAVGAEAAGAAVAL